MHKILVVGCGIHFRTNYFKVLEDLQSKKLINLLILIDLQSQQQLINDFLLDQKFSIPNKIFLPANLQNYIKLNDIDHFTKEIKDLNTITHIIISCEPKVRKSFIMWAIQKNWNIFVDKPLTAFIADQYHGQLYKDYVAIKNKLKKKNLNFVISCERRYHKGYEFLKNYIARFIQNYQVPISFININFGGGSLILPSEFINRENHPFKYGYGILLHSGYHYIDLFIQLLLLNKKLYKYSINSFELKILYNNVFNMLHKLNKKFYQKIDNSNIFDQYFTSTNRKKCISFGEIDVLINGQVKQNIETILTNFSINLLKTSVSAREDMNEQYIDHGRIRQENLIIHLGSLCSIQVRSLPYRKLDPSILEENFEIIILNNPTLTNEKAILKYNKQDFLKDSSHSTASLNISARQKQLIDFLNNQDSNSSFDSHCDSIRFLDLVYLNMNKSKK